MLQQQKTEMVPLIDGIAVQTEQFNFLNFLYSNFSQASFINRSPIFYENAASFSLSIRWELAPLCEKIHLQGWKLKIDKILGLPKGKKKKKLICQIGTGDNTNSSHSSSVRESIIYIFQNDWFYSVPYSIQTLKERLQFDWKYWETFITWPNIREIYVHDMFCSIVAISATIDWLLSFICFKLTVIWQKQHWSPFRNISVYSAKLSVSSFLKWWSW